MHAFWTFTAVVFVLFFIKIGLNSGEIHLYLCIILYVQAFMYNAL